MNNYIQELQQKAKRIKVLAHNEEQENLRTIKQSQGRCVEYGSLFSLRHYDSNNFLCGTKT